MVCDTCESKLSKLVVPDKWKAGARNVIGGKDGGVRVQSAGPSSINKVCGVQAGRRFGRGGVES